MKILISAFAAALFLHTAFLRAQEVKAETPANGAAPEAAAQNPAQGVPVRANVFVEVQMVAVPLEIAPPLVRDLMDKDQIESAYEKIQGLIAKGTAKLIGWPMLITHSGERAVFEAIHELRYATEYDTGGIGVYYPAKPEEPLGEQKEQAGTIFGTEFNATPTAFETRNTGVTLEVEPVLSPDEKTIELNLVPQDVRLKGMHPVTLQRPQTKDKVVVEQPEFDTMKTTLSLTLKSGQRMLLGVYPTSDPANHLELFILKAEARKVE